MLFTTLEQGQSSQKWTPFWELFEDQFCTKYENNEETEDAQKLVQKKGYPPQKLVSISGSGGSLTPPSRARNKKQFDQQQQQLQQLWLNVDFCFQNCPVLDETCKKRMLLIVRVQRLMI